MNNIPIWLEVGTFAVFVIVLVADFLIVDRRPHAFSTKEATFWAILYIALAVVFNIIIFAMYGSEYGGQFAAAFLTEKALSVDNLFVFLVIMTTFAVPAIAQHRVLLIGVLIALVLRAIMILVGVSAIQAFKPTFLIFGVFLFYTAIKVGRDQHDEEKDIRDSRILKFMNRLAPTHHEYNGHKFTILIDGKKHLTPMVMVMIAIGTTDIMFALDSIPAVLGLTSEPFLVLTSNAFALMGLRQLYFLLNSLISRLIHLAKGLAIILAFIAVKLLLLGVEATFEVAVPHIPTNVSLIFIATVLTITTVTSLRASKAELIEINESIEDAK
jgi:tellurite resistance protein TerC